MFSGIDHDTAVLGTCDLLHVLILLFLNLCIQDLTILLSSFIHSLNG